MKKFYHKPNLTIHGSIKQITGRKIKGPGSADGQADPGSGIIDGSKPPN